MINDEIICVEGTDVVEEKTDTREDTTVPSSELKSAMNGINKDIQISVGDQISKKDWQNCLESDFWGIIEGSDANKILVKDNIPLEVCIEKFKARLPNVISNRPFDKLKNYIGNIFNQEKKLNNDEIEKFRRFLIERIDNNECNTDVRDLCKRILANPYRFDKSTFENWLDLLIKNSSDSLIRDLNDICNNLMEKELSQVVEEEVIKSIANGNKRVEKNIKNRKQKSNEEEHAEENQSEEKKGLSKINEDSSKLKKREYMRAFCEALNKIGDNKSSRKNVVYHLNELKDFLEKLHNSEVGQAKQNIDSFLLSIIDPELFNIQSDKMNENQKETAISSLFDLGIGLLVDKTNKEKFTEALFKYDSKLATGKSVDILRKRVDKVKYPDEIQKLIIEKLTKVYSDEKIKKTLNESKLDDIKSVITKYISEESEIELKTCAFKLFSTVLSPEDKKEVYPTLLRNEYVYKLYKLHEEILTGNYFESKDKKVSIGMLADAFRFHYSDLIISEITTILDLMEKTIIADNTDSEIRDYISSEFYQALNEKQQEKFLRSLYNAIKTNNNIANILPLDIRKDLDKAGFMEPDTRKQLKMQRLLEFVEKKKNGKDYTEEENDLIAYILTANEKSDDYAQRRELLREILNYVKE